MSKKATLAERWASDKGYTMKVFPPCHRCKHRQGESGCAIYGTIPPEVMERKKGCPRFSL